MSTAAYTTMRSALRSSAGCAAFSACTLSRPWSCSIIFTVKVTKTPPTMAPVTLPEPPRMTMVMASNEYAKLN